MFLIISEWKPSVIVLIKDWKQGVDLKGELKLLLIPLKVVGYFYPIYLHLLSNYENSKMANYEWSFVLHFTRENDKNSSYLFSSKFLHKFL